MTASTETSVGSSSLWWQWSSGMHPCLCWYHGCGPLVCSGNQCRLLWCAAQSWTSTCKCTQIKMYQLACLRPCPLLPVHQCIRPWAGVNWDDISWFLPHTLELYWPMSETVLLIPSPFCTCRLMSERGEALFWYAVIEEFPLLPSEACCVVLQLLLGGGRSGLQVA